MVRALLVAGLGIGLATPSAEGDRRQLRYPELCVEAACSHLSQRDCSDTVEVDRLLRACTANYDGECVRTSCGLLGTLGCNEVSELMAIAHACSNNVDGSCLSSVCRRLGSTGCDDLAEVTRVARQCGRANPYTIHR